MGRWRLALRLEGDGSVPTQELDVPWPASGGPPLLVGAGAGCDLVVPLEGVCPRHLELRCGRHAEPREPREPGRGPGPVLVRDVSRLGAALRPAAGAPASALHFGVDTEAGHGAELLLPWRDAAGRVGSCSRAIVKVTVFREQFDWRPQAVLAPNEHVGLASSWKPQAERTHSHGSSFHPVEPGDAAPLKTASSPGLVASAGSMETEVQVNEAKALLKDVDLQSSEMLLHALTRLHPTGCARRLERATNSVFAQVLAAALALAFCVGTLLVSEGAVTQAEAEIMIVLGLAVAACSLFEFFIAVVAQVGSWRIWHFFWPLFHKVMIVSLLIQLFCVCEATAKLLNEEYVDSSVSDGGRITIISVVSYRSVRALGIYLQVSVKSSILARQQRVWDHMHGVWGDEHRHQKMKQAGRVAVRLQRVLDSTLAQVVIIILVLAYCGLYAMTISWQWLRNNVGRLKEFYWLTRPAGYSLLALFTGELVLRCWAQQGERFFVPVVHKVEIFVLFLGMVNLGYSSVYMESIQDSTSAVRPQASVTALLLLLHRILRLVELRLQVAASRGDANSVLGASVAEWLRINCGDIVDVPRGNIKMACTHGVVLEIRKAMVKPQALKDLHLPVTIAGVYLEELFVHLPQLSTLFGSFVDQHVRVRTTAGQRNMASVLRIRGLTVLLEPGAGLHEAGVAAGVLQADKEYDTSDPYWVYERLVSAQARVVSLICGQFPWALGEAEEKVQAVVDQCMSQLELDFKRVRVTFTDPKGALGRPGSISLKVGSSWTHWVNGTSAAVDVTRVSLQIDPGGGLGPAALYELKSRTPRELMAHLLHEDTVERWRWWAMGLPKDFGGRQKHEHAERWDLGRVVGLLRLRLRARACLVLAGEHLDDEEDFLESAGGRMFWHVHSHPVSVVLDEMQAMYVKRLLLSAAAWANHDRAFRWRPTVRPADGTCSAVERTTVARLWWQYAVKRVVATLPWVSSKRHWLEGAWLAVNRRQYAKLLRRSWQGPRTRLEQRLLQELQLQIGLEESLKGREAAFLKQLFPQMFTKDGHRKPPAAPPLPLDALAGHWHGFWPSVELRLVLRGNRRPQEPRDMFLTLTLERAALDVQIPTVASKAIPAATLSLDELAGYYFPKSSCGVRHNIIHVKRPLDNGAVRPRPPLLQGTRSSRPLTALVRLALKADGIAIGEVHLADLDVIFLEPYVVGLLRNFVVGTGTDLDYTLRASGSLLSEEDSCIVAATLGQQSRLRQADLPASSTRRILGPFAAAIAEEEEAIALDTFEKNNLFHVRTGLLKKRDMLEAAARGEAVAFELLSCARGELPGWELDVHIGQLKCTQVGDYSPSTILVEEFTLGPFHVVGGKVPGEGSFALEQEWARPVDATASRAGASWLPAAAMQLKRSRRPSTQGVPGAATIQDLMRRAAEDADRRFIEPKALLEDAPAAPSGSWRMALCSSSCTSEAKALTCCSAAASRTPSLSREAPRWTAPAGASEQGAEAGCQVGVTARVLPRSALLSFVELGDGRAISYSAL